MYVCTNQDCVSFESPCLLQKSTTLLAPVQMSDPLILGYFVDSCSDQTSSTSLRFGRYIYCSDSQQLVKVSRVPSNSPSTSSTTILIQKMALVSRTMIVNDFMVASFPHHDESNYQPLAHYIVHSRTLSFHTLIQTAQRAGFLGYVEDIPTVSPDKQKRHRDVGILANSFYGAGIFGVYDGSIVPCKFPPGARGDDYTTFTPQPAYGAWAVPEHFSICRGMQMLRLGLSYEESSMLRTQFTQAMGQFSHRSNISSPPTTSQNLYLSSHPEGGGADDGENHILEDNGNGSNVDYTLKHHQEIPGDRVHGRVYAELPLSHGPLHSTTPMTVMLEAQEMNDGGLSDEKESIGNENGAEQSGKLMLGTDLQQSYGRGGTVEDVLDQEGSPPTGDTIEEIMPISRSLPERISFTKPLTTMRTATLPTQNTTSIHDNIYTRIPATTSGPLSVPVLEPMLAPVSTPVSTPISSPVVAPMRQSTPITTKLPAPVQVATAQSAGATYVRPAAVLIKGIAPGGFPGSMDDSTLKEESLKVSSKLVKKTLPAPTKSEIVIRNRISAQRSNEKRRRKIEATKSELAYLKSTYLPQLEHRHIALATENRSLRLSFMQKYNEKLETFF